MIAVVQIGYRGEIANKPDTARTNDGFQAIFPDLQTTEMRAESVIHSFCARTISLRQVVYRADSVPWRDYASTKPALL